MRLAVAAAHRRARAGVSRAVRVVAGAGAAGVAAVVAVNAGGAVVARVVAAPLELDAAGEVHWKKGSGGLDAELLGSLKFGNVWAFA